MIDEIELASAARTDVGRVRAANEDSLLNVSPCFLVADGMGGYEAGDLASLAALSAFSDAFPLSGAVAYDLVAPVLNEARRRVSAVAAETERGAGCTLSGVVLVEHNEQAYWYLLNIGDSRVYLHRDDQLVQLTADHSLYEELRRTGHPDAELAPRHVITRALGSQDSRHDAWLLPVEMNTRLLICTDGLTGELADTVLNGVLTMGGSLNRVVDELVDRALASGGRDNVTVIVVEVLAGGTDVVESEIYTTLENLPVDAQEDKI